MIKMVYLSIRTTGLSHSRHGIHQIAGAVEIDGEVKGWFRHQVQPQRGKLLDPQAMADNGITMADLEKFPRMEDIHDLVVKALDRFIDKADKRDKAFFAGYNASFTNGFVRRWFRDCGNKDFNLYFHAGTIDVGSLALYALRNRRHLMPSFRLNDVAAALGCQMDDRNIHDALHDVKLSIKVLHELEKNGLIR